MTNIYENICRPLIPIAYSVGDTSSMYMTLDYQVLARLKVGDIVTSLSVTPPTPTPPYFIAAIFYCNVGTTDLSTMTFTPATGKEAVGIVLAGADGTPVILNLSINPIMCVDLVKKEYLELQAEVECYPTKVYAKQCQFAKDVFAYITKLKYGIQEPECFEKLKEERRKLFILACYDTRDIIEQGTVYNTITYDQIKQLL